MAFTVSQLSSERFEKITYKHNADVNAWEPINVEGLGPLIPVANTKANLLCVYYRFGIFKFTVANSITITAGDAVYYDSLNKVVRDAPLDSCFYLGKALSGGIGNETGTVSVEVSLNNPAITANFGSENITTTGNITSGDINCNDLASTGNITCTGDINCNDLTSSGIVASTSSQVIGKATVNTVNATATLEAEDVIGGIVKSTPEGNIDITLPAAAALLALVPGAVVGTTVKFKVVNCATESHSITLKASDTIINGGVAAHLGVAPATAASFEIVFTNVTDSVAAELYRG